MVLKCLLCRFEFQTSKRLGGCRVAVAVASKDEMFANEARGWACCVKAQLHSKFLESGMFERPKNNAEICPRTLVAASAGLHGEKCEGQVEIFKKLTWIIKVWMAIWNSSGALCIWFACRFISEGRRRQSCDGKEDLSTWKYRDFIVLASCIQKREFFVPMFTPDSRRKLTLTAPVPLILVMRGKWINNNDFNKSLPFTSACLPVRPGCDCVDRG